MQSLTDTEVYIVKESNTCSTRLGPINKNHKFQYISKFKATAETKESNTHAQSFTSEQLPT